MRNNRKKNALYYILFKNEKKRTVQTKKSSNGAIPKTGDQTWRRRDKSRDKPHKRTV